MAFSLITQMKTKLHNVEDYVVIFMSLFWAGKVRV